MDFRHHRAIHGILVVGLLALILCQVHPAAAGDSEHSHHAQEDCALQAEARVALNSSSEIVQPSFTPNAPGARVPAAVSAAVSDPLRDNVISGPLFSRHPSLRLHQRFNDYRI